VGLAWGIFVSFVAAALLAAAGNRVRRAHRPEPPLDRADRPSPAPGEAVPVRIPEDRPHLAETRVLGDRSPLSREAAARDTADFGVVPAPDEAPTERVSAPDEAPTKPVSAGENDAGEEGEGPGREGEQPRLPGI
jgi:hypothetical protein